ncbi:MAG: hypothetical protein ABDH31_02805 [Chlorobiota bacterium]
MLRNLALPLGLLLLYIPSLLAQEGMRDTAEVTRWERAKRQLERWKLLRLLEEVRLDETTGQQFLLLYTTYNRRIDSTLRQIEEAANRLSAALQTPQASSERERALQDLLNRQQELLRLFRQRTEAMRSVLSEEQFARYVLFEHRFPREMERTLFQHRFKRRK